MIVNTVAGGGSEDGLTASTSHVEITGAAVCPDRTIVIASIGRLYRITTDGLLDTIAGTGVAGFSGDGGAALAAKVWLFGPIVCDAHGDVIFAANGRIRRIDTQGIISTIAGNGLPATSMTDSNALSVPIDAVSGLATDANRWVYFAEPYSNRVRVVKPDGTVALFAGSRFLPSDALVNDGDGGPATAAHISSPTYLAIDAAGNVYMTEGHLPGRSPQSNAGGDHLHNSGW